VEVTRDLLTAAAAQLSAAGVPTPEVDAELLLAHVTGRPRALLRMAGGTVTVEQSEAYAALVGQRVQRIPLQHLTGLAPFRHLELHVGPGVFIPRPETELIVDHVLEFGAGSGQGPGLLVVDLCSGSAALALSIATELPGSRVIAVELSPAAVGWARRNIADHAAEVAAVGSTIELLAADATRVAEAGEALGHLHGRVDVVVTNPPYVPADAIPREPEVRDHDPGLALYGGPDGLEVVRPLVEQAALLLRPGGLLLVEHADVQGEDAGESGVPAVLRAARDAPSSGSAAAWREVIDHPDLAGRPRHTSAIRAPGRMAP
jgi:release factor glutamine methyltransferase